MEEPLMVEVRTIVTEKFAMDYISFGSGPRILVVVPGMSLRSVMLQADAVAATYKPFLDRYTVFLFDRIRDVHEGYTVKDMADDTAVSMLSLGLSGVHMIGHSQGGMIAMHIAAGYPGLVSKLILSSTSACLNDESRRIMEKWSSMAAGDDVAALNHSMFGKIYSDEYLSKYKQAFGYLERMGTRREMDRLKVFTDACLTHDARESLKSVRCPVFILCSAKDKIFPVSDSEYIARATEGSLYVYEGYSHAVYDEAPDFKSRMLGFLTE